MYIRLTEVEQLEKSVTAYPAYQKLWHTINDYSVDTEKLSDFNV